MSTKATDAITNGTTGNGQPSQPVKRFSIGKDPHDSQRICIFENPAGGPPRVVSYVHDPRISRELVDAANASA